MIQLSCCLMQIQYFAFSPRMFNCCWNTFDFASVSKFLLEVKKLNRTFQTISTAVNVIIDNERICVQKRFFQNGKEVLAHQIRKSVVLAWDRNSVLTQANYINALQFYSTAGTTLNKVKGNFSVVLCKKKNPIWVLLYHGRFQPSGWPCWAEPRA